MNVKNLKRIIIILSFVAIFLSVFLAGFFFGIAGVVGIIPVILMLNLIFIELKKY
ncbi:hypothetical protein [Gilliamella sp. Bif1-4]|uniref:hypothetical protein n=1 Tax=Gilliamella sp. Bif1-4 TaxID=3120233 RepID=UPI00159EC05B|nr:hypothetical protein [Gilliamella apicola]